MLDISELVDRKPKQLSGGQRQRVAMGRAIVRNPKVFLFDEPLSNLDAKLRVQMRIEIKKVHQKVRTTTVYVTHDQVEAMTLADRVVVMNHGRIEQIGTPNELYHKPATRFVASFIGSPAMNFIPCQLEDAGGKLQIRLTDRIAFPLPPARAARYQKISRTDKLLLGIRPEHVTEASAHAEEPGVETFRRRPRRHRADGHGDADLFPAAGRAGLRPGQSQCRRAGWRPAPIGCGPQQYAFAKRGDRRRPLTAQEHHQGQEMASNKKKIFITESFSQAGRTLLGERDDIEMVEFSNMISAGDFQAKLREHAPVHGVALGATRFGETELEASGDMKVVTRIGVGFDAVDVPALSKRKVPLMVAGTANSPSVAEQALFMMLTLAKRASEMDTIVKGNKWAARLGALPYDLFGKTVLIVGFGRIGTRTAKRCLAMEMNGPDLRSLQAGRRHQGRGLRAGRRSRRRLAARRFRQHPLPEEP